MLTPLDIHNKVFTKGVRGYKLEEVDAFLDEVIRSYEALFRENRELKDKVGRLEDEIEKNREISSTLQKTMILAEKVMEEESQRAEKEAELIKRQARQEGEGLIEQAKKEVLRIHQEIERLKLYEKQLYLKHKGFLEFQMELLDGYKGETAEPADEKAARVLNHGEVTLGFSSELAREGQKIDGAAEAKEAKPEERKPEEAGALPAWKLEPASEAAAPESGGIAAAGDAGQAEGSAPSMAAAASETARELSPGVDDLDQMARKMEEALEALDKIYGPDGPSA